MIQAEATRNFTHRAEFRGGGGGKARGLLGVGWGGARSERALPSLKPTHQRPEAFGNPGVEAQLTVGDVSFYCPATAITCDVLPRMYPLSQTKTAKLKAT